MTIPLDALHAAIPSALAFVTDIGLTPARNPPPQQDRVRVSCPWHNERNPSCGVVTKAPSVMAKCYACGGSGDAIGLAAAVWGLSVRDDFPEVIRRLADMYGVAEEGGAPVAKLPADPIKSLADRLDTLADNWTRGAKFDPSNVAAVEAATETELRAAFRRLREQDAAEAATDAALAAVAPMVLADITKRERAAMAVPNPRATTRDDDAAERAAIAALNDPEAA